MDTNDSFSNGNHFEKNELSVIVERLKSSDERKDDNYYEIKEVRVSSSDFLLKYPRGAYTSSRTVKRNSIMDLQSHIDRTARSLKLMKFIPEKKISLEKNENNNNNDPEEEEESPQITKELIPYRNSETLKRIVVPLLRTGLTRYFQIEGETSKHAKGKDDVKVTILVCYSFVEKKPILVIHFMPLYSLSISKCKVEFYGEPRKSAAVKDSQWVRDRESLEKSMLPGFNEVLLSDSHTHNIYEGLSSNFFAVLYNPDKREPLVVTAPLNYVVEGTILKIVRMVCARDKIDFQFWFPNTNDVEQWEGAFITSTSRLVLPIELIKFRDGRPLVKLPPHNDIIEHIKNEVEKEIYNRAYRILL